MDPEEDTPYKKPKLEPSSDPRKFTMDERGRLLDSKGRAIDLPRASVFSLSINQEKAAKKGNKLAGRYLNNAKLSASAYSRDFFFDPNIPKAQRKEHKNLAGFVFGDEVKAVGTIRADIVPTVEWWDRPILSQESYCEGLNSDLVSHLAEMKKIGVSNKDIKKEAEIRLMSSVVHMKSEAITWEVDHPTPVYTAPINTTSHTVVMHLTEIEKRKLKRLKKAKKLQDLREKMKLGLLQPPPQKIKLSNMVKLLAKEATADPSRTEQEVMSQYNQRLQVHEQRNEERKLSKPQKLERALRKLRRDSARESRTVVFRVERLRHKKNLFKVGKNAEELALVGCCIRLPEGQPTLLVVEGGKQALKMYKNLCLRRINWNLEEPPGACNIVWEAEIKDAVFRRFSIKEVASELEARKLLGKRGVEHYFDLVNNWKPPAEL